MIAARCESELYRPLQEFSQPWTQAATFASLGNFLDYVQAGMQTRDLDTIIADSLYDAIIHMAHSGVDAFRQVDPPSGK